MKKHLIYNNAYINYEISGAGQTIVLLHGFTESISIWSHLNKDLSKSFQTICIDLPGHGKSQSYANTHHINEMADVVYQILLKEEITYTILVGHSMGGYISLAFSKKHPEQTKGICLLHSTAASDSEEQKNKRLRTINIIEKSRYSFLSSFIPDLFAPLNIDKFKNEIQTLIQKAKEMPSQGIIAALRGMMQRDDYQRFIENTPFPIFFITGAFDKRLPIISIQKQANSNSLHKIAILENSGHMGFIEEEEQCKLLLNAFIKDLISK